MSFNKRQQRLANYGISRKRYKELCAFCEQYPEWLTEIASASALPPGSLSEHQAARLARLKEKVAMVEKAAQDTEADLKGYLVLSACYNCSYVYLHMCKGLAMSERAFSDKRRLFFFHLSQMHY